MKVFIYTSKLTDEEVVIKAATSGEAWKILLSMGYDPKQFTLHASQG